MVDLSVELVNSKSHRSQINENYRSPISTTQQISL